MEAGILEDEIGKTGAHGLLGRNNYFLSFMICASAAVLLSAIFDRLFHWLLIPVVLCGTLIGNDAIEWFKKDTDTFDPKAVFGLYGIYFFFVAPMLHVILDYWMKYVTPPPDWRPWLGYMAFLNLLGLIAMVKARDLVLRKKKAREPKKIWTFDKKRFLPFLLIFLAASFFLQIYVYASRGGLIGYITAYTEKQTDVFQGMGWVFMISESFPILAIIGFAVYAKGNKFLSSWPVLTIILLMFLVAQFLFGGLRGSRSNTVFMLIWAVGIIHFWIRPVPKKMIIIGLSFLFLFMYFYAFYKAAGIEAVDIFRDIKRTSILEERTGRDEKSLLLGDFSRSDVQAFILYRISGNSDYRLALGRTYVGALSILIPRQLWHNKPPTKVKEGTDVMYGMGTYSPDGTASSNVYGMSGEAMLNFGPLAVVVFFVLLGILTGIVEKMRTLETVDSRNMLVPLLIILPVIVLVSDLDNIIFALIKQGFAPFILIFISSAKENAGMKMIADGISE